MKTKRIAVIGLDGMHWTIIDDFFKHGVMPHLKRLAKNSVRGVLKSTVPPTTPPAWTSIVTGVNPGKHGIFDFVKLTSDFDTRIVTSNDVRYPRIHEMVAFKELKSVCINLPLTFPILRIKNSVVVSDWLGPKVYFYPKNIEKYMKNYRPYSILGSDFALDSLYEETTGRVEAVNDLMEKFGWNLFFVVFMEPDHIFHRRYRLLLEKREETYNIFNEIDKTIDTASGIADLVIVVSDHGFSKYTHSVSVNSYLDKLGLVAKTYRKATKGIGDLHMHEIEEKVTGIKRVRTPLPLYKVLSFKPVKTIIQGIYKLFTGKNLRSELPYVDPIESKAFSPTVPSFGINVKEKSLVDLIINKLKGLEGIEHVWKREEIYQGPYVDLAPDIIFLPDFNRGFKIGSTAVSPYVFSKYESHYHHPDGIVLFGKNGMTPKWIENIETVDIVPTILNYLGLPLPPDTDGKPVPGIVPTPSYLKHYDYLKHWMLIKQVQILKTRLA